MRRGGIALLLALAAIVVAPAAARAASVRIVDPGDTATFDATKTDTTVRVGDTVVLEVWLNATDTFVNGLQFHLEYDQAVLQLREFSDATDSFPQGSAGIQVDEDHAVWGDILKNQGDGDTILYAALTNDSQTRTDTRVLRMAFTALAATGANTTVVGFRFSPETTAATAANTGAANVLAQFDSGAVRVLPPQETHVIFTLVSPGATSLSSEFFTIYNPTDAPVDLSNYYVSDDDTNYYRVVTGAANAASADFIMRFPAGTTIGVGETITVALSSTQFHAEFPGVRLDFELDQDGNGDGVPGMTVVDTTGTVTLTNGGEPLILFYWDQSSDLVKDVEILVWGTGVVPNKTNVAIDGPDADTATSTFLGDSATMGRPAAPGTGQVLRRTAFDTEPNERRTGGNGIVGHDETSESATISWASSNDSTPWHTMLVAYRRGDLPAGIAEANETGVEALTFHAEGAREQADSLLAFVFRTLGTADTANIDTVSLYIDANSDSVFTAGTDTFVADLNATGPRSWSFNGNVLLPAVTGRNFLVVLGIDSNVQNGETFVAQIDTLTLDASTADSGSFVALRNPNALTLVQGVLKVFLVQSGPTATVRPGDTNVTAIAVRIQGAGAGADTLLNVALANDGLLDSGDVTVKFWRDNGNLAWSAGDTLVGTLAYNGALGYWFLQGLAETLAVGGDTFLFTIDVANTAAVEGDTFRARVPASSMDAVAAETGPALAVSNANVQTLANPAGIANHVTVAGVYVDDLGTDGDGEWILLYNPTASAVPIDAWTIRDAGVVDATIPNGAVIPAHRHYLIADAGFVKDNAAWPNADYTEALTLNNTDDGLSLVDSTGATVDRVGWGAASPDQEGTSLANPAAGTIYVRKANALSTSTTVLNGNRDEQGGGGYDSFENATDFVAVLQADSGFWTLSDSAAAAETAGRFTTVVKIADTIPNATAFSGETRVEVAVLLVAGETSASGALNVFRVEATDPILDTEVTAVQLWRDNDANLRWSVADSLVANLAAVAGTDAWESAVVGAALNSLAGETFVVTIDVFDTPTSGETFQARVSLRSVRTSNAESGPTLVRTNTGIITLQDLDPIVVVKGPNIASDTVAPTADTLTVIAARIRGAPTGDTLTRFTLRNLGTMDTADVGQVRLWVDGNGDSVYSAGDVLVATLAATDSKTWASTLALFLGPTGETNVVVTVDLATAGNLETFRARIPANSLNAAVRDTGPTADVDEVGTITASTAQSIRALLVEVDVEGAPDFVEILVLDDGNGGAGANLRGWSVWDYPVGAGTDRKVIGDTNYDGSADVNVTVRTGERIVVFDGPGTDETSSGADSVVEAYGESMTLTSTEDEVVLYDPDSAPRDAVVWANRDGGPAAGWESDFLGVIQIGAWETGTPAFGDTTHNNAVTPRTGTAFNTNMSIQRGGTTDNDSYLDWGEAGVTQGAANAMESPPVAPPRITSTNVADVPNDLGGALRVSWTPNTGVADFLEYRVYVETVSLSTLLDTNILPRTTVTDSSVGTATITGLTNGASYRAVVTMADSYGLEFRFGLADTGPAVPAVNITETPAILITEVFGQATGGADTDYVELYVADDGNPAGGIDLTGWTVNWQTGGPRSLSGITANRGNYIVIDFSQASDTAEADSGADNVITIAENDDGLVSTDAYVEVRDPNNRIVHFVFLSDRNGTLTAAVATAVRTAIDSGAWTGETVENAAVTPNGAAWASNEVVALAFVDSRIVAGRDSFSVTTVRSKGSANVGIESPATVPAPPTITSFLDVPNDQGGSLEVRWTPDTSLPDFLRYAIYVDTRPIRPRLDTGTLRPRTTVTDSGLGSAVLSGLTNGESYWVAVTIVDTWAHERRGPTVLDTGPVAPADNITGTPVLLFSEVLFAAGSTDAIEIRVVDDGNPAGALNLSGYKIAQDDTVTPEWTFGSVTVQTGDFILVRSEAGTSEVDSGGDGVVEQRNATFALPETDEGLFIIEPGGDTIVDFVFWSGRDQTMTASEVVDLSYAIARGAWTGTVHQGNGRNPFQQTNATLGDFADTHSITRTATFDDSNSKYDWAIDSTPTLGAPTDIGEDPFAPPAPVTGVDARDNPGDFGGRLLVTWDPSGASDFSHYHVYVETTPIADLRATDSGPEDTVAPASDTDIVLSTANGAPLANGTTYWVAVTAVDKYGNETLVATADTGVPVANVSGERLLITEASFAEGAVTGVHGHDWVEVYVDTDGTGGAGLNLNGWRLVSTADADKTFGSITVRRGDFIVVHYDSGLDEADSMAGNADSIVDVYVGAGTSLQGTDNVLTLFRSDGDTEDFVAWTSPAGAPVNAGESTAIANAFAAGHWTDFAPTGVGVEDGVNSDSVTTNASIRRTGTTNDSQTKSDWDVDTSPTPGETNSGVTRWRIFGTVDLETRAVDSDVVIQVADGANTYTARSDAAGTFVVRAPNGTYNLIGDTIHYLRKVAVTGFVVSNASQNRNVGRMVAGDANNDERIDVFDAAVTKFAIDAGTGSAAADHVDPIGTVNQADLGAVRSAFGRRGD